MDFAYWVFTIDGDNLAVLNSGTLHLSGYGGFAYGVWDGEVAIGPSGGGGTT